MLKISVGSQKHTASENTLLHLLLKELPIQEVGTCNLLETALFVGGKALQNQAEDKHILLFISHL